tara:strand:- start:134 stop:334 length:201 start_codon:yes stop_codon:yes gene_type:complete
MRVINKNKAVFSMWHLVETLNSNYVLKEDTSLKLNDAVEITFDGSLNFAIKEAKKHITELKNGGLI